ncbi:MAG: ABC transporter ATP-binding protein [Thermoproteota archaeon]
MSGLAARNVWVRLNGAEVLRAVSLEARPGELTVVVGPNGAGKTTLLKVLAGILEPSSGTVEVEGTNLYSLSIRERAKLVAYIPPTLESTGLGQRVEEFVAAGRYPYVSGLKLGPDPRDIEEARRILAIVEAGPVAGKPLGKTSSGEMQRAMIAQALVRSSPVLVADEPTSFQDLRGRLLVYSLLKTYAESGRAVVVATHDFLLASLYADKVVVMRQGEVVAAGPPSEVLSAKVIEAVFGVEVEQVQLGGRLMPVPVRVVGNGAAAGQGLR